MAKKKKKGSGRGVVKKMPQKRPKNALKRPPNSCREKARVHKKARGKHKIEEKEKQEGPFAERIGSQVFVRASG